MVSTDWGGFDETPPAPRASAPADDLFLLLADHSFSRLTELAARLFGAPMAVVSVPDAKRIRFAARYGLDLPDVIGGVTGDVIGDVMGDVTGGQPLCDALLHDGVRVLCDIRRNAAAMRLPIVCGPPWVRFYAGMPLVLHDGARVGALCVFDTRPRRPRLRQLDTLHECAGMLIDQIELRRAARASLAQKEDLIKEINHRVSNSLQVVSNLLVLQARGADDALRDRLDAAAGRVSAVAQIHRRLYQADRVGIVDFKRYLDELCADIHRSVSADEQRHEIVVEADAADISTQRATALGLILNEVVTNAVKHAYPAGASGRIVVGFRAVSGEHCLLIEDGGCGLPPGADLAAAKGLGMRIIHALAKQLGGSITFGCGEAGHGTAVTIRCPQDTPRV